jgi:hypothetical protein
VLGGKVSMEAKDHIDALLCIGGGAEDFFFIVLERLHPSAPPVSRFYG